MKDMNTTANNIEVIATGLTHPHTFNSLDNAISYAGLAKRKFPNCEDAIISVNGIMMPPSVEDDETFFYASAEAAKSGKVWFESVHGFVTQSFKSEFESDCFDWEEGEYEALVSDNIYKDVWDYEPVTGEAGEHSAIVRDKDVADLCEKIGYSVLHCGNSDHILEDGTSDEWWVITPDFHNDSHDEDEDDETILDITGEVAFIKPIVKSIYRAWDRGAIDFNGFCDCPGFNPDREYRLTVIKNRDGYISLYVKPTEDTEPTNSNPGDSRFVEYEETGEVAFIGNHLRGYWNPWDSVAHFHVLDDAGHLVESSVGVELDQDVWKTLCGDIEDNPGTYGISVETDYAGNGEYGTLIHHLDTMPDRYTDTDGSIHRTSWEYLETNGDWVLEEESDTEHVLRVAMFGK